ncbi:DUF5970 family protein [Mechercharimyces sp. CAU 1602]|uniref:DUF5970 family protein n=1 Tax=Mechercharimyces sp. CAU 1602 TaxID=2973933 RepID=UPI0037C78F5B
MERIYYLGIPLILLLGLWISSFVSFLVPLLTFGFTSLYLLFHPIWKRDKWIKIFLITIFVINLFATIILAI